MTHKNFEVDRWPMRVLKKHGPSTKEMIKGNEGVLWDKLKEILSAGKAVEIGWCGVLTETTAKVGVQLLDYNQNY